MSAHQIGEAEIRILTAEPEAGDASDLYVLEVLGVTVAVHRRRGEPGDTCVHVGGDEIDAAWRPLTVSVNNAGEHTYGEL
jgi:hypothetical protein